MNEGEAAAETGDNSVTRGKPETESKKQPTWLKILEIGAAVAVGVAAFFTANFSYMYAVVNSIWVPILVAVAAFVSLATRYSTPVRSFASAGIVVVITVFIGASLFASMLLIAAILTIALNSVAHRSTRKATLTCMFTGMGLSLIIALWWGLNENFGLIFLSVIVLGLWSRYNAHLKTVAKADATPPGRSRATHAKDVPS